MMIMEKQQTKNQVEAKESRVSEEKKKEPY
jgi:hypothetical protein